VHIPLAWARLAAEADTPGRRRVPVVVWGWGDDEASARREAAGRLQRLLERLRRGEPFPGAYAYGARPLREEILRTLADGGDRPPVALLTRNGYGAVVLNTARRLFLDVDAPSPGPLRRLAGALGLGPRGPHEAALGRLRAALREVGGAAYRLYRTASGLRVMAVGREFDPRAENTQALMAATGTDPAFARLCRLQGSFRARLTPKPWRCGCPPPPGEHPRQDPEVRRRFDGWLRHYEAAALRHATCRYLETVGETRAWAASDPLVELHDRLTRCGEALPLA
jgi:hypothetical protein